MARHTSIPLSRKVQGTAALWSLEAAITHYKHRGTRKLRKSSHVWLTALAAFSLVSTASAQTIIPGPTTSGTWSSNGNPYIVTGNITVPDGQTLMIQPGVVVEIGSGLTITADGTIQAVGTPSQRITFQAPISSQYWSKIWLLSFDVSQTNHFKYCDFLNASTALVLDDRNPGVINIEIMNCTFSNCLSRAIYMDVGGGVTQIPVIKNCIFSGTSNGCVLYLDGAGCPCAAYANATIIGNIFQNLTGSALSLTTYIPGSSTVLFMNNTLNNCKVGVSATDPWDAQVQNNIFVGCTNAMKLSGSLSQQVSYNDFYRNAVNFSGYVSTYGPIIWVNRNGTPADILYNIYQDPIFAATPLYYLSSSSPCIDSGAPGSTNNDTCFPPSQGTAFNDQGVYGGPWACKWPQVVSDPLIVSPPTNQVAVAGTAVTLAVVATGTMPLNYQWQFNTNPIPGATSSNYFIASVQLTNAGNYSVIVSNSVSKVSGPSAILTVILPIGLSNDVVNPLALPGSVVYSNGVFTVTGSGEDIQGTADAFEFVHATLTGDGQIVARVTSLAGADPAAEAGVMIRESLAAGSTHAFLRVNSKTNVVFRRRLTTDAYSIDTASSTTNHNWLRLMRMGSNFVGLSSTNGVNWEYVWFTTVNMSNKVQVGLSVTSHHNDGYATAIFDNVAIGALSSLPGTWPLPGPWIYMGGEANRMTEIQRVGGLKFLVGGVVGDQFSVKCSTNPAASLASWPSLGTVTNTWGVATFLDSQALTNRLRFYRVQRTGP
jgi:hypothetical protein